MPVAEVDIVNRALIKIGSKTIMALDTPDSKRARLASITYPSLRDRVLVEHPWNFARRRAQRSPLDAAPAFGWGYAYSLPPDALRVWDLEGGERFTVEGREILTDAGPPLFFRYIARVEDTTLYPPQFVDYLVIKLAAELSFALASSADLALKAQQEAENARAPSYLIDSQEGTPEAPSDGSWLMARL